MKQSFGLFCAATILLSSCSLLHSGGQKNGCPSNGKNIGAEKLASGDPKAAAAAKKAGKFKMAKSFSD